MALGPLVPGAASADPGRESAPIQVRIDGPSTIPFESPSGLVIMTARINGRFHVRLLLDTGDPSGLTLDLKAARTLGLPLSDKTPARATGVVGSGRYMLYRARIRSFLLGGLSAPVAVTRDGHGVPTIEAANLERL